MVDPTTDDPTAPLRPAAVAAALLAPAGPLHRVAVLPRTGSTSTDLADRVRADPAAWADRALVVADHQEAGRGRAGHTWLTPRGTALTFSLSVRPPAPPEAWGWLPLLTGLGVVRAVRAATGLAAELKWPNDVLVPGGTELDGWGDRRKVAGLLAEVVPTPDGPTVVLGIGVNVAQGPADLPVPSATSLRAAGGRPVSREDLLAGAVRAVLGIVDAWGSAGGDVAAAGLDVAVAGVCATLGARVGGELPGGGALSGTAEGLAADGALLVREDDGVLRTVHAGDVRHLRRTGELGSSA